MFNDCLQPSGLRSTQFVTLVAINAEGSVSLPRLAGLLDLNRSALTRNLRPLERAGLLKATAGKSGGASSVKLTSRGGRVLAAAVPLWEEAQGCFVKHLGKRRWASILKDLSSAHEAATIDRGLSPST